MEFFSHRIPHAQISDELNQRLDAILQHGKFINGPEVRKVEQALADYVGVAHVVACNSGTDALMMALLALDIQPNDEIITSAYSYYATAEIIEFLQCRAVFVDIEAGGHNLDPDLIEAKISDKTKAIMPVSLFGEPANFKKINAIAEKYNLPVIEDGAQSFGATHHDKKSLSLSTIGCTSFFPTKPLGSYGDGGACFTDDAELADKMRYSANHGQTDKPHVHIHIGFNSRLDSVQAAVLLCKLAIFDETMDERRRLAKIYNAAFADIPHIVPLSIHAENQPVYAQYIIRVPHRAQIAAALANAQDKIPTAIYYPLPLPHQPALQKKYQTIANDIPHALAASQTMLALPFYVGMSDVEQAHVITQVKRAVEEAVCA